MQQKCWHKAVLANSIMPRYRIDAEQEDRVIPEDEASTLCARSCEGNDKIRINRINVMSSCSCKHGLG